MKFYQTSPNEIPELLNEKILYSYPNFSNFPASETPLSNYEFQNHIYNSKNGLLIYLQSIQVVKVYPPEVYLWMQFFLKNCDCENTEQEENRTKGPLYNLKHLFVNVLKNSYNDLRACIKKKLMICKTCGKDFKELESKRIFLNCQKIEAYVPELKKNTHLWVSDIYLNKLKAGMSFNAACYYDINLDFSVQNGKNLGTIKEFFVLISADLNISVLNKFFFENCLINKKLNEADNNLFDEWLDLKSFCDNNIGNKFIPKETLVHLKTALFCSIALKNRSSLPNYLKENNSNCIRPQNKTEILSVMDEFNLHLFILGEIESVILRMILDLGNSLENFGVWPYSSDDNTLYTFLYQMQNCIVFIPDAGARLRRTEIYLLSKILKREEIEFPNKEKLFLNTSLWFYGSPNMKSNKQSKSPDIWTIRDVLSIEGFDGLDLIIDISRRNANLKRIKHLKFDLKISDQILESFSCDITNINEDMIVQKPLMIIKKNEEQILVHSLKKNENCNYHDNSSFAPGNHFLKTQPNRLMQAYFKTARKAKAYSLNNYNSFRKVCLALSLIRSIYKKKAAKIELFF